MENRHLHFNVITGAWMLAFLMVSVPALKFVARKTNLPGFSQLVGTTFGS